MGLKGHGRKEISYVLHKLCESHLLKAVAIVIGAHLRFSKDQCTVLQTYLDLIKNSQTQNGIRSPILDLSLSIQDNQEVDLCPENVGRASRFSPLWLALRCSLTTENK